MPQDEQERRKAERQGTLAAIAPPVQHEVNNLLTVVLATLETLKRSVPAEGPGHRQIERVALASRRLEELVRAYLTLARRPVPDAAPTDLPAVLRRLEPLLRLAVGSKLGLSLDLPEELPQVSLDRAALDAGLLELARDAAERVPRGGSFILALAPSGTGGVELVLRTLPPGPPTPLLAQAAEAVGGTCVVEETESGTTLRLMLPAAPAQAEA